MKIALCLLLLGQAARPPIIADVRQAIGQNDFARGEALIEDYRKRQGVTPEMLEALSWLGRGALAAKDLARAERYAAQTRELALEELKKRPLDAERHLPIALGASIEVQAQVMAGRNERSGALAFLEQELAAWRATSIRTRIQKNIHLLSLEGKPAPELEMKEWIGLQPQPLATLKGKPLLLFFWAHWCGDCKQQGPVLARLQQEYGPRGLVVVGPTQRYGYAARGQEASPADEKKYIESVFAQHYQPIVGITVPLSEENFRNYGSSTTPTLVLVDAQGIVRMYHPGKMPYEALQPRVETLFPPRAGQTAGR